MHYLLVVRTLAIGIALVTSAYTISPAQADYISWGGAANFYYGKVLSISKQDVVFQIECTGPTIKVPWGSTPMSVTFDGKCMGENPCDYCGGHPCHNPTYPSDFEPGTRTSFLVDLQNGDRHEASTFQVDPGVLHFQAYKSRLWYKTPISEVSAVVLDQHCDVLESVGR